MTLQHMHACAVFTFYLELVHHKNYFYSYEKYFTSFIPILPLLPNFTIWDGKLCAISFNSTAQNLQSTP